MISLTPKEIIIHIARHVLGEKRVHDHLIQRGIELRHLQDGYAKKNEERREIEAEKASAEIRRE